MHNGVRTLGHSIGWKQRCACYCGDLGCKVSKILDPMRSEPRYVMDRELKFPNYVAPARARDSCRTAVVRGPLSRTLRAVDKRRLLAVCCLTRAQLRHISTNAPILETFPPRPARDLRLQWLAIQLSVRRRMDTSAVAAATFGPWAPSSSETLNSQPPPPPAEL
jgi:hypothetical protein